MSEDRWDDLKAFVSEWTRPLTLEDGIPLAEIEAAEARLGFRLPEALREAYQLYGKREALTRLHNRLVLPKDLELWKQGLIVWEENQCVVLWSVREADIALPNPAIWLQNNGVFDEEAEEAEGDLVGNLSDTALLMVTTELVAGGEFAAHGDAPAFFDAVTGQPTEAFLQEGRPAPYGILQRNGVYYWGRDVLLFHWGKGEISLAARSEEAFHTLEKRYPSIVWSYTSME